MNFHVFRCAKDPDYFIVTDEAHLNNMKGSLCPRGGELNKLGEYAQMGKDRVAFDETLAMNSINNQGYYRFEAKTFDPVGQAPEMP